MNKDISILDCTLRDGGYVNGFLFGETGIQRIIKNLNEAGIDIVECGFLMDKPYDKDKTIFSDVDQIKYFMPEEKRKGCMYVAMIAYGDIQEEKIKPYDGTSIDGIRITFHKPQLKEALDFAIKIKEKGYKIFIQPVGTTSYSDAELLQLIEKVNQIKPYAFYLVDTLSILNKKTITHLFSLTDKNLEKDIYIGYHSHNNLQLAFSNAQEIIEWATGRSIILDSSVFGMGRGAGNLCTELIVDYLNRNTEKYYNTIPILELLDGEISTNYSKTPWGYNTPYFLASTHKCHPNYATFLLSKQTISAKMINDILNLIPIERRDLFDKKLIEQLYISYQTNEVEDKETYKKVAQLIEDKPVLVIGAGSSIIEYKERIKKYIKDNNPYVISINFVDSKLDFGADMGFFSNAKKFLSMDLKLISNKNILVTSNILKDIEKKEGLFVINYSSLLLSNQYVFDNAGLMLLKFLSYIGIKKAILAGFDGFTNEAKDYIKQQLFFNPERREITDSKNLGMKNEIRILRESIDIEFITPTLYE